MNPTEPTVPTMPAPQPAPEPVLPPSSSHGSKKSWLMLLVILLVALAAAAAGYYGRGYFNKPKPVVESKAVEVTVPKDAMVTAECVAGRGKQYILAKDIPDGPIYDVVNGKVVAVEYLVGLSELLAHPENFKDLMLQSGTFDHLSLIPTDPHAGMTEQHFHAISYAISADQAKSITCNGGTTTTTDPSMHM